MTLRFYNTASRELEDFVQPLPYTVKMYNCGPTVYNFAHIGNLRPYVFADVLRRTLEMNGYEVKQVINITDVGHLVGDADDTEDKMTVALKREGKPLTKEAMREVGDYYAEKFKEDLAQLHILPAFAYPKASDYILEDIALVENLIAKGFAYTVRDGIYFDTSKFPSYADFAHLDIAGQKAGMRIDVGEKKNSTDFALWKFDDGLGYDAPFGKGFPGWHIECSAMIEKFLGHPIDIHTGGVDHIPVHHTNEIAQSESAYGAPFVKIWMHTAHMTVDGEKMSKSLGNTYTLAHLRGQAISPSAFRYWLLTANYRTQVNFTWTALEGAQQAHMRMKHILVNLGMERGEIIESYRTKFTDCINNDLNTAEGIAVLWELLRDSTILHKDKLATMLWMDTILGLGFEHTLAIVVAAIAPQEVRALVTERQLAREQKNYTESDRLRDEIRRLGYEVKDTPEGQKLESLSNP